MRFYRALLRTYLTPLKGQLAVLAVLLAFARVFLRDPSVVIAHRLETVQRVDDVLVLEDGAVAEYGPRARLAADPGSRFAALLRAGALDVLEVRGLRAHHPGGRGVGPVDLTLRRGTLTVLTGRIGAGKSTLLEALLGLRAADGGEVRWNGLRVDPAAGDLAPPRCAYVPQAPCLVSETLGDNILQGQPAGPAGLDRVLRLAALDRDVPALERGLDTIVGPRGVRLSGGQAQRAATALA